METRYTVRALKCRNVKDVEACLKKGELLIPGSRFYFRSKNILSKVSYGRGNSGDDDDDDNDDDDNDDDDDGGGNGGGNGDGDSGNVGGGGGGVDNDGGQVVALPLMWSCSSGVMTDSRCPPHMRQCCSAASQLCLLLK